MFNQQQNYLPRTPIHPTKSIATKIILIPDKLIKTLYRKGIGQCPKPGASIYTIFNCYTINGKYLIKKNSQGKRFTVGIGRLIQGLQNVLMTVKKQEKFTVIIPPQLGYKNIDINIMLDSKIKNQKLVFQFQIISIDYLPMLSKSQPEGLANLKLQSQEIQQLLTQHKHTQAIQSLKNLIQKTSNFKYQKSDILTILHLKHIQILYNLTQYKQSLQACQKLFYLQPNNSNFLILLSKIYLKLNNKQKAKSFIKKCYNIYKQNIKIRRIYVEFMKQLGQFQELGRLQGYNLGKDQLYELDKYKNNNNNNNQISQDDGRYRNYQGRRMGYENIFNNFFDI